MSALQKIKSLSRQLYPSGRVFKMPYDGIFDKLNTALATRESEAYDDAVAILNSILPDNANFTADDATDWERRLGIYSSGSSVPLADRKLAIQRKMNHPGDIVARQHYLYLQGQLQAAGFDVYVFENTSEQDPATVSGVPAPTSLHGQFLHGQRLHGGYWADLIANHIDPERDAGFSIGDNLRSTFFIGGDPLGTYAEIPLDRKKEFRQLVLRIKPVQTIAFLFLDYTY